MSLIEVTDVREASDLAKRMREASGETHPIFSELRMHVWRGCTAYLAMEDGAPVSLFCGGFGKRKKNIFEPYLNWISAYTLPAHRRNGHATALYRHAEATAVERGCRRIRSLAGSALGARLHMSLGHQFWGQKETGELFVDSPLPGHEDLYKDKLGWRRPPLVPESEPWTYVKVRAVIQHGLRYDK